MADATSTTRAGRPRRILVVCTGNVSRSPLAAATLRSSLRDAPYVVESRGTHAPEGARSDAIAREAAAELGTSLERHRARLLTAADLERVELVVVHERRHGAFVTELDPAIAHRIIPLAQLAAVARSLGPLDGTPRARIERLLEARALGAGIDADIPDPLSRPIAVQREIARTVVAAARDVARSLTG